jgi:hypothetical protein
MKLIGTNGNKTFKIIPRQYINGGITVKLTSESTGTTVTVTPTASTDKNYMSFDAVFGTLIEGEFYILEVKNGDAVIYKDKVFCTDQTINQANNDYYSINKDEYVQEDSFDNDYIIL